GDLPPRGRPRGRSDRRVRHCGGTCEPTGIAPGDDALPTPGAQRQSARWSARDVDVRRGCRRCAGDDDARPAVLGRRERAEWQHRAGAGRTDRSTPGRAEWGPDRRSPGMAPRPGPGRGGALMGWFDLWPSLREALFATLYMVSVSAVIAVLGGLPIGVLLIATDRGGLFPAPLVNRVLSGIVNLGRSIPFIILMVALIPVTRAIVKTSLGSTAAIVPLSIAAIPFY